MKSLDIKRRQSLSYDAAKDLCILAEPRKAPMKKFSEKLTVMSKFLIPSI